VLDDEGKGKSWLTLVLSQELMGDTRETSDILQDSARGGEGSDAQKKYEAREIIEKAQARVGLITVLTRRLESSDDLLARIAAAELRDDPHWRAFTRGVTWYARGIWWGGKLLDTLQVSPHGHNDQHMGWHNSLVYATHTAVKLKFPYVVRASANVTRLEFVSQTPGNCGAVIDLVSVV
jgi:hypothetical protein